MTKSACWLVPLLSVGIMTLTSCEPGTDVARVSTPASSTPPLYSGTSGALDTRAPWPSRSVEPPQPGAYRLLSEFAVRGCARYQGGCFERSRCVEERTQTYRVGQRVEANVFLWDDSAKQWGVKVVDFGQSHSIPMSVLARVE